MIERQSDKKNHSKDLDQLQTPKFGNNFKEGNDNLDIEYLLNYINLEDKQQLNLSHQNNLQNHKNNQNQINFDSLLYKYVLQNSSQEDSHLTSRTNLVQIIDSGIRFISKVKNLMRKQGDFKKTTNCMFRQLFYGNQDQNKANKLQKGKNSDQRMRKLRLKKQIQILTIKSNYQTNQHSLQDNFKYLLTQSFSQVQLTQQTDKMKLLKLQNLIQNLQKQHQRNTNKNIKDNDVGYLIEEQKLEQIWKFIGQITQIK